MTEPYWPSKEEIEEEILVKALTAIVLPYPGIYAGGENWTTSVLMGLPEHTELLWAIEKQLTKCPKAPFAAVKAMSFAEALILSKQQAREACDV